MLVNVYGMTRGRLLFCLPRGLGHNGDRTLSNDNTACKLEVESYFSRCFCLYCLIKVVSDGGVWTTTSPVGAERDIERAACAIVESQLVNDSEVPSRDDICLVEKERGRWCRARVVNLLKSLSHGIVAE